ncbi:MAG: nodulation protein NfeD [Nitrospirota bacterium]|nr:nodulation protein NfeD [Nitrospirota bacterium]
MFAIFRTLCLWVGSLFLLLGLPSLAFSESPLVIVATYEGVINPVAAEYLHAAIAFAEEERAELLVFQLDTPGGLDTSMRTMIKDIIGSQIPIGVYVFPSGGRAASAGVFITLAAHVAAMAPGTNIGAAHPVAMGGGKMDKVMKEKVENDAVAYIRSLAERRGRNAEWAEDAVLKSVSATGTQAKELGLIDFVVADLPELLQRLDGQEVKMGANTITLRTQNAMVKEFPMGWRLEALKAISDPNIAYALMTIGMIGLIAEMYNPGAILPGIVGAISLILAFYSLQSLPVNYAGVLLLLLGIVLLILEVTVTSFGLLAIGGVISMILGSLLLMNDEFPYYQISWSVILPVVAMTVGFTFLVVRLGVKALRARTVTGSEGMVGLVGLAKTNLAPDGKIFVHGEIWDAVSVEPVQAGNPIEVTKIDGLKLYVKPAPTHQEDH